MTEKILPSDQIKQLFYDELLGLQEEFSLDLTNAMYLIRSEADTALAGNLTMKDWLHVKAQVLNKLAEREQQLSAKGYEIMFQFATKALNILLTAATAGA